MSSDFDISKGKYWQRPWSIVDGCTPCSPGCEHCWSAGMTHRFDKSFTPLTDIHGKFLGKIITRPDRLDIPLKRRKPTVYAVWNDLFHEDVPDSFRDQAYRTMRDRPDHTFLILTKRPENMIKYFPPEDHCFFAYEGRDIYHGLTICNQQEADGKYKNFIDVPGKKLLSLEPMLDRMDITQYLYTRYEIGGARHMYNKIDAVILGGETGSGARPLYPDWVRSIRDQCVSAEVPFFFKGWGEWIPRSWYYDDEDERDRALDEPHILLTKSGYQHEVCDKQFRIIDGQPPNDTWILKRVGRKKAGRLLDGRTHDELPWRKV